MKPARNSETKIMRNGDTMWGICLGADYTAEHEWGILSLLQKLKIDPDGICVEGRSMTSGCQLFNDIGSQTKTFYLGEDKPKRKKVNGSVLSTRELSFDMATKYAAIYELTTELTGAWDGDNFVAVAWSDDAKIMLSELNDAFLAGNVTIWLGGAGDNPFANNNLIIAITDRIPEEGAVHMNQHDLEVKKLHDAAAATGISDFLISAFDGKNLYGDKPWHALKANWAKNEDTEYPVVFFLNPLDQKKYNYGWFTVEELKQWAVGEGPVIK